MWLTKQTEGTLSTVKLLETNKTLLKFTGATLTPRPRLRPRWCRESRNPEAITWWWCPADGLSSYWARQWCCGVPWCVPRTEVSFAPGRPHALSWGGTAHTEIERIRKTEVPMSWYTYMLVILNFMALNHYNLNRPQIKHMPAHWPAIPGDTMAKLYNVAGGHLSPWPSRNHTFFGEGPSANAHNLCGTIWASSFP